MTEIVTVTDLPVSMRSADLVMQMIAGANAQAARVAPCLVATDPAPTEDQLAEAKLILLGAISRWVEAGSGALTQHTETKGPYSESDTYATATSATSTGYRLWPVEIGQLQDVCKGDDEDHSAYGIDTAPIAGCSPHADICSINFGATYCSCGAVLTNLCYPLYERCD